MNFLERLKEETKEIHQISENHAFNKALLNSHLSDQKYFVYLHNIFPIFSYIERRLDLTGELVRSPLIHVDIMKYAKDGNVLTPKDLHYFDWIHEIGSKADKFLPAIVYVEWLKDVFGGKIISQKVKHNSLYQFNNPRSMAERVRSLIVVNPEDEDEFILETKKVFENHNQLLTRVFES
jgi:heme oxygenase